LFTKSHTYRIEFKKKLISPSTTTLNCRISRTEPAAAANGDAADDAIYEAIDVMRGSRGRK